MPAGPEDPVARRKLAAAWVRAVAAELSRRGFATRVSEYGAGPEVMVTDPSQSGKGAVALIDAEGYIECRCWVSLDADQGNVADKIIRILSAAADNPA
jgi:hypothetical protein